MFWQRLMELCKERNTKPNPVAASLGISSGAVTKWKNGTIPNGNTLQILADYFEVPVDYLIGKTDDPSPKQKKPAAISDELWKKINEDPEGLILLEMLYRLDENQLAELKAILNERFKK